MGSTDKYVYILLCRFQENKKMEICFWVVDSISSEEDGDLFVGCGFILSEEEEKAYMSYWCGNKFNPLR